MSDGLSISLWAVNLGRKLSGRDEWLSNVEQKLVEAKQAGSSGLIMPEWVSEQWLTYAPGSIAAHEELAFMAEEGAAMIEPLTEMARRHGMYLLAGSWAGDNGKGGFNNRGHVFFPDEREPFMQDKFCLTPGEQDPAAWNCGVGGSFRTFDWNGYKAAFVICLDIEMPALSAAIARNVPDLDILFVPSMTEKLSGYSRVFGCAKARAVELLTVVCAVGCIGATPLSPPRPNVSGCSIFTPCEEALGFTGLFAEEKPVSAHEGLGPVLHARNIPVDTVRKLRTGGAEVWPGAWKADHISF